MELVNLPGGSFWMGCDVTPPGAPASDDEEWVRPHETPRRRVCLSSFSIARLQVSQRLYQRLMGANPSAIVDDDLPVTHVTWREAMEFCNALSRVADIESAYFLDRDRVCWRRSADGYRLPTEAEWEYAAAGLTGRTYPWGDAPPGMQACWNGRGNALGRRNRKAPSPVWSFPEGSTPEGIIGMAGNVWEWCWDWFAPYEDALAATTDPWGPASPRVPDDRPMIPSGKPYRVLRGGAWNVEHPKHLKSTTRRFDDEGVRDPDIGFRVARGASPGAPVVVF